MPITLPSYVAPNELIQSAWGNAVVDALDELDTEKLDLAGGTMTGQLLGLSPTQPGSFTRKDYVDGNFVELAGDEMTGQLQIDVAGGTVPLVLRNGSEVPSIIWSSQAGTTQAQLTSSATFFSLDTLSNNPFLVAAPTRIETGAGSEALTLRAVTETPVLDLESTAGTSLFKLTAGAATSTIDAFDDLQLRTNSTTAVTVDGGTQNVTLAAGLTVATAATLGGALDHNGTTVGFYGAATVAQQTGVAVTAAAIHAALVNLGLITA